MKVYVGLGGEIWVFVECCIKVEFDFFFVGSGGMYGGVSGCIGFNGVVGFQNVEIVVWIVCYQYFQWLYDILFRSGFVLLVDKCFVVVMIYQYVFIDQFCQCFV